jgi:hypothetical protein
MMGSMRRFFAYGSIVAVPTNIQETKDERKDAQ